MNASTRQSVLGFTNKCFAAEPGIAWWMDELFLALRAASRRPCVSMGTAFDPI